MKDYLFSFLTVFLVLGVLISSTFEVPTTIFYVVFSIGFFALILCLIRFKKWMFIPVLILFCSIGSFRVQQYNQSPNINEQLISDAKFYLLEIKEKLNDSERFYKYKSENENSLNILFYLRKSSSNPLNVGDRVWVYTKIQEIPKPKNPYQFNYANYLKNKRIYVQCFVDSALIYKGNTNSWSSKIFRLKRKIKASLLRNGVNEQSVQLISALVLGDRTDLDSEQKKEFSRVGVMHLLAISGLHVGIIFGIVFYSFSFLKNIRFGRKLQIILSLSFVWCFAAFVNFSPSVSRACLMLTIYFGSTLLNQSPNIFHTISLSAFVLLFINPNFLFDVGFQLSYCAVFFIVWLFPSWRKFIKPKNKVARYFSDLIGVSICAQLGVLPLSIYYFHQFSMLFLIGNLVLIPSAGLLIVGGFVCVISSIILTNSEFLITIYNAISNFVFWFIETLSNIDILIFTNLYISKLQIIVLFILIFSLKYLFIRKYRVGIGILSLGLLLIFQIERSFHLYESSKKKEIIVFHQNKNTIIGIRNQRNLEVFVEDLSDSIKIQNHILEPYVRNEHIQKLNLYSLEDSAIQSYIKTQNLIEWNHKTIFIGNHIPEYESQQKIDYFILNGMNKSFECPELKANQTVILNSYYNQNDCETIWNLNEKGAFILQF